MSTWQRPMGDYLRWAISALPSHPRTCFSSPEACVRRRLRAFRIMRRDTIRGVQRFFTVFFTDVFLAEETPFPSQGGAPRTDRVKRIGEPKDDLDDVILIRGRQAGLKHQN